MRTYLNAVVAVGAAVAFMAVAAGCAGAGDDRAGGQPEPTALTLTMANGLYRPEELQPFADEVARRSGGKMRIEFRDRWLGWPWHRPESAVIHDVAAGKADLGWVGSRAWDDFGISSFNALQVPLLVDSYALQVEVLESGIPGEMLKALEPLRLVGLGILPGPLRKLLGVERPLTRPADFRGQRIGITEFVSHATLCMPWARPRSPFRPAHRSAASTGSSSRWRRSKAIRTTQPRST